MPRIVISYRRADTGAISGRIFDRLTAYYGRDSVFRDVDNVPLGVDFRDHIAAVLDRSSIVLVIVGKRWFGGRGAQNRLDDPADPVRVEVETALTKDVPVIPILVDRVGMPKRDQLPDSLKDLVYRTGLHIDAGADFDHHMDRLVQAMDGIFGKAPASSPQAPLQREAVERSPAEQRPAAFPIRPSDHPEKSNISMAPGAIFISYAHEDQAAARRLRDFLEEEAGVDVWLDTRQLEAGDDWGHKTRRNIKSCSYFMPLISAASRYRPEGYFRREWSLAAERAMDFVESVPFIIPIAIDDTPEDADGVPERFRQPQWTRLPGGAGNEDFRRRMVALVRDYRRRTHE